MAEKRLRIKGRFVTNEQALEILGLTQDNQLDNAKIQELLTQFANQPFRVDSLVENRNGDGQMIKVRNLQTLLDDKVKPASLVKLAAAPELQTGVVIQEQTQAGPPCEP